LIILIELAGELSMPEEKLLNFFIAALVGI
jgi:hypothetical protein